MGATSGNAPAMRLVAIDDDPKNLKFVNFILAESGLEIHTESDAQAGLELIHRLRPQIVLMDLIMPGVQGMELLQKIVEFDPGIDVILMTGYYSTESAVEAIQKGAADYFPKPFSPEKLRQRIALIVEDAKRRQRSSRLDNELLENFQFQGIIGRSPLMLDLFSKIQRIAPHFRSVLVTGPTGSGKELVARALHQLSGSEKRFVAVNCSSITETLAESELFGHVKGAFTGANQDKVASSSMPTAERRCWTRLAKCPCPCSRSCCGCCKTTKFSAWVPPRSPRWTCAWWLRHTATCRRCRARGNSARTSISGSAPWS